MFISPEIISKIWYLCHKINTVEWSGLVFCKTEGHPINPETFSIRAIDILPMHKGEPTYTEFEIDERIIDAYDNNPELEDCKMGIIHSHVNMGVFFSGTDSSTLNEYAKLSNFCISLIVNNKGEMVAKVAYPINNKTKRYAKEYKDSDGNWIALTSNLEEDLCSYDVVALDLDIVKEMNSFFVDMTEKAIKESQKVYNNYNSHNYHNYAYGNDYDIDNYNKTPQYNQSSLPKLFDDKPFVANNNITFTIKEMELFLCKLMFLDPEYTSTDNFEQALMQLDPKFVGMDQDAYALHMEDKVEECYKEVFFIKRGQLLNNNTVADFLTDVMEHCLEVAYANNSKVAEFIYTVLADYFTDITEDADTTSWNNSFNKSNN
jgi:proteasome lid subunit RPN8/RPN11